MLMRSRLFEIGLLKGQKTIEAQGELNHASFKAEFETNENEIKEPVFPL